MHVNSRRALENYSLELIQDMIYREVSAAFKIRVPPEMPSKKEIKSLIRSTVKAGRYDKTLSNSNRTD